jgi:hypothetical protein
MIASIVEDVLGVLALAVALALIATGLYVLWAGRFPTRNWVGAGWRGHPPRRAGLYMAGAGLVPALGAANLLTHGRWALVLGGLVVLAVVATIVGWLTLSWKQANRAQ